MKRSRHLVAGLAAGLLFAASLSQAADYSAWTGSRNIVLNTSASGANVAGNVTKFPVLVRLTQNEANIVAAAKPGGADIRFSKADGTTPLPYQIDTWEPWGASIWVLVDSVKGNNSTQFIKMYWGNPAANSESNVPPVFDTANGFVGVWNLGNAAGASPRPNSVVGAPTAQFRNAPITQQPVRGIIGMADSLTGQLGSDNDADGNEDGKSIHLDMSGTTPYPGYANFTGGISYSVWVNPNGNYLNYERFLQIVDDTTNAAGGSSDTRIMFLRHTANNGSLAVRTAGLNTNNGNSVNFPQHGGAWKQVAFTKAPGNSSVLMYVDGQLFHTLAASAEIPNTPRPYAWIGRSFNPTDYYLNAKVDAPMLSKVARSADWMKLSFENQKASNSLVDIGLGGNITTTPYSAWSGHRTITLNTTAAGANVSGNVLNFPVLIRLTAAEALLRSESKAGGADIRFSKTDNTPPLPYHIESWDSTGAAIWVKLDTVKGNFVQTLRMHWGNPAASDSSRPAVVFDTANGHVAVWHMNGTTSENDVTVNALNAAATGTVPAPVGLIGKARSFGTVENYLSVPGSATGKLNFEAGTDYTLSAWVYSSEVVAATATGHAIVNKGNDQWLIGIYGNDEPKYYDLMTRGNDGYNQAATSAAGKEITAQSGVNTWRHVVGTWKGSGTPQDTGRIYINGVLANMTSFNDIANTGAGRNLTYDVFIGVLGGASPSRPFIGRIDEVTASKVVRDSNWVKLAYQNQKPGNALVDIGTYVEPTAPSAPTAVTASAATTPGSVNVSWTAPANNGGSALTSYTVTSNPGAKTCTSTAPAVTCTVTALTGGTSYTFTVTATNASNLTSVASAPSNSVPVVGIVPGSFSARVNSLNPYTYRLSAASAAVTEALTMTIVDVHGKRVWSRTVNPSKGGGNEITWNGFNTSGERVSAGMYIVRVSMKAAGQTIEVDRKSVTLKP
jgi:hypothetical protein